MLNAIKITRKILVFPTFNGLVLVYVIFARLIACVGVWFQRCTAFTIHPTPGLFHTEWRVSMG
jgi:hypothetical protein